MFVFPGASTDTFKKISFFDIGKNSDYYDDFANRTITRKVADRCYLPANRTMLDLIRKYGKNFKVSFSISGMVIEQFREYAPEVIDSFKRIGGYRMCRNIGRDLFPFLDFAGG